MSEVRQLQRAARCAQIALLEGGALYEPPAPQTPAKVVAANAPDIDRNLPAQLPREPHVHRPETITAHHDSAGQPCGCTAYGGRLFGPTFPCASALQSTLARKRKLLGLLRP